LGKRCIGKHLKFDRRSAPRRKEKVTGEGLNEALVQERRKMLRQSGMRGGGHLKKEGRPSSGLGNIRFHPLPTAGQGEGRNRVREKGGEEKKKKPMACFERGGKSLEEEKETMGALKKERTMNKEMFSRGFLRPFLLEGVEKEAG